VYRGNNANTKFYEEDEGNSTASYSNFISSEPNSSKESVEDYFNYIALSLDENDSKGIPRGGWVLLSEVLPNPALYQCCVTDFATCTLAAS